MMWTKEKEEENLLVQLDRIEMVEKEIYNPHKGDITSYNNLTRMIYKIC